MTTEALITILVGSNLINSAITAFITSFLNRRKTKVEVENMSTQVMNQVLNSANQQLKEAEEIRTRLVSQNEEDREIIAKLEERIATQEQQNQECEVNNAMLLVELDTLRKMIVEKAVSMEKMKVAVLDDNPMVTYLFQERLRRVSLVDVTTHTSADAFVEHIKTKPDILIIDYHLGRGVTLETIMHHIVQLADYHPKIVVITADNSPELRETVAKLGVWRFYHKDGPYINLVTRQIIDLLAAFSK